MSTVLHTDQPQVLPVIPTENDILPVTVVIPVKNAASALEKCLAPLRQMAAVLVVDSASEDATAEIARRWGAEVLQFRWNGGFPKKRNWVLQNYSFSTEWVLFLDADETLTPACVREIRKAVTSKQFVGYWASFANHFQGRLLRFGVAQRKLVLFRVGAGLYERIDDSGWSDLDMEVHEHPVLKGPVGSLRCRIDHNDDTVLYRFIERHNKYSTWEAQRYLAQVREQKETVVRRTFRQRVKYRLIESQWLSLIYFFYTYIILGGIFDGRAGLTYAIYKATYFFDISQKIQEVKRNGMSHSPGTIA